MTLFRGTKCWPFLCCCSFLKFISLMKNKLHFEQSASAPQKGCATVQESAFDV